MRSERQNPRLSLTRRFVDWLDIWSPRESRFQFHRVKQLFPSEGNAILCDKLEPEVEISDLPCVICIEAAAFPSVCQTRLEAGEQMFGLRFKNYAIANGVQCG